MKKSIILCAAVMAVASVSAQTVTESKSLDNWYVGVNGGLSAMTTHTSIFKNLNPTAGLRIGRNFTPVFGIAADGVAYFDNATFQNTGTTIRGINVNMLGTVNFSNWFYGYPGTPRTFEVVAVAGLGGYHICGSNYIGNARTYVSSKLGVDFNINLGKAKAWQINIEPSLTYLLNADGGSNPFRYDINNSWLGLSAGVTYKFGNSNGTHNFTIAQVRDQNEIDGMNAKINELRSTVDADKQQMANDKQTINNLTNELNAAKQVKTATVVNKQTLQPTVIFQQGKSSIEPAQYASVAMIAKYMKNHKDAKILVKGYASPEGSAEINQKLSNARAEAVKTALIKKYHIDANRLSTKGMGATDKLFDEVDFNRVATFDDTTMK
jgi:outer membrane protein OmpA-like peptidoglycan-associated protein